MFALITEVPAHAHFRHGIWNAGSVAYDFEKSSEVIPIGSRLSRAAAHSPNPYGLRKSLPKLVFTARVH
jgi:hypothetical protein